MDKKPGVYICSGCGIGDCLNLDKLSEIATKEHKLEICKTHTFLCGEEGAQLIRSDIEAGVNTVVIAGCSPRARQEVRVVPLEVDHRLPGTEEQREANEG